MTTKTRDQIIEDIIQFFKDDSDTFADCIEELDAYKDYLYDDRYYPMEELDEFYSGREPIEILQRAFYGYDADRWNTDSSGEREYGPFNPNRDYFRFNAYGNLVSTDWRDYSDYIDSETVEKMLNYRTEISAIDSDSELSDLFDELEEASKESEDESND